MLYTFIYVQAFNDTLNVTRIERRVKNRISATYNILYRTTNGASDPSVTYIASIILASMKFSTKISNI